MTRSNTLFHITTRQELDQAQLANLYLPKGFATEGFIHCSYPEQVVATANRIFRGQTDLVLLEIKRSHLTCAVIDENLEGDSELFPHIYGPLPLDVIRQVHNFPCDSEGSFQLPVTLR